MTTDQEKIKDLERKLLLEKEARKIAEEVYAESSIQFAAEKESLTDQLEVGSDMLSKLQNLFNALKEANDVLNDQYEKLQSDYEKIKAGYISDAKEIKEMESSAREDLKQLNEKVPGMVIEKAREIITELITSLPEDHNSVKEILIQKLEEDYCG